MSSDLEDEQDFYDDMDEVVDDFATESETGASSPDVGHNMDPDRKVYEVEFETLPQPAVEALLQKDIEHVSGIFSLSHDKASLLLRHQKWNKEKLIETYMDSAQELDVKAGVSPRPPTASSSETSRPHATRGSSIASAAAERLSSLRPRATRGQSSKQKQPPPPPPTTSSKSGLCQICFDEDSEEMLPFTCGHAFCANCWSTYARGKIREEGEIKLGCMSHECTMLLTDTFIRSILRDDVQTITRFQELIVRHYVDCIKKFKFCPFPNCTHTVACPSATSKSALETFVPIVKCGASEEHQFCFGCNIDSDHRPVICSIAKLWQKKCSDDSETSNWINSNTKECPECQSIIEKNGGCNHMTCKKCKWEFCWVCMGVWAEHGNSFFKCNRYDESSGVEARDAQSKSRAALERYLHYYNRWANHEQSAKLSVELFAKTERKMDEMQLASNLTWIEVQFAKTALDEVFKCRMTLKWTYAMAYYLARGNQKQLFEDNQNDLERAVEDLSELLESPIEPDTINDLRQKITNKTAYVRKRNEIVLQDTAQGFLDDRWRWETREEEPDEGDA